MLVLRRSPLLCRYVIHMYMDGDNIEKVNSPSSPQLPSPLDLVITVTSTGFGCNDFICTLQILSSSHVYVLQIHLHNILEL